jgi:hypothetical protein
VDDHDAVNWEGVRSVARNLARRGVTAAEVREYGDAASFWQLIADEVEIIEARYRFEVLRGGASRHPLAVRMAAIAHKHPESAPALALVPAGTQRRYRR